MKNCFKKIFLVSAVVLLLSVFLCFGASAATEGVYTYSVIDGEARITAVDTSVSGAVTTPTTLGGYPVTSIGGFAFDECTKITKVTVSQGVKYLGYGAFNGCTSLADVEVADSVTNISYDVFTSTAWYDSQPSGVVYVSNIVYGYKGTMPSNSSITLREGTKAIASGAFIGQTNLMSVIIPDSVESICTEAFSGCISLNEVSLPKNLKTIGGSAFQGCTKLTSVTIPENVTEIGYYVFDGCSGITSVTLENSSTSESGKSFMGCENISNVKIGKNVWAVDPTAISGSKLKTITVDENNPYFSVDSDGVLYNKDKTRLVRYPSADDSVSYTVPDSVKSIGSEAFKKCEYLSIIDIPSSVESVGANAFDGCTSLTTVNFSKGTKTIGDYAFNDCTALRNITLPESITDLGKYTFTNATNLESIVLPDGLTNIDDFTFFGCTGLKDVTIPDSVKRVGWSAFYDCTSLSSLSLPDSTTEIDRYAFDNTGWFNAQPDGAVYIGKVFYKYKGDGTTNATVTVNDGTKSIANGAFAYNSNIYKVTIPSSVTRIGNEAFFNNTNLVYITLGGSVEYIGDLAFYNCIKLFSISLPSSVKTIGREAFKYCSTLTAIDLGENLEFLGESVFDSSGVKKFSVSSENPYFSSENGVIYNKDKTILYKYPSENAATSFTVPSTVKEIKACAFYNATNLSSISIPDSVVKIGAYAFESSAWYEAKADGLVYAGKVLYKYKGAPAENASVSIQSGTLGIAEEALKSNDNITTVTVPESVKYIGANAFESTDWYASQPCGLVYAGKVLYKYKGSMPADTKLTIDKAGSIADEAFAECKNLTEVTIGEGVESIGNGAFYGCENLQKMTVENAKCEIYDSPNTIYEGTVIYGYKSSSAKDYADKYSVDFVSYCAHKNTQNVDAIKATCISSGYTAGVYCNDCETYLSGHESISAKGHIIVTVPAKEATCTTNGYTESNKCSECNKVFVARTDIAALGHKEIVVEGIEATCIASGISDGKKCSVCGVVTVQQQVIEAKGHSAVTVAGKKATCTVDGLSDGKKCSVCGVITVAQKEIAALGHKEVALPAKAATYTADGLTAGKKCSVCGKVTVAQKKVARKTLGKVKNLKVKSTQTTEIKLSWSKVTGAESYKVYYSTNGKSWKSVKTTKNTATVKKLKSGTNYQFKVKAVAGKYSGTTSSVVKTATKVAKATVKSVKSTKAKQAVVTWNKVTGASGYVVEYSTSKKFTSKTTKKVTIKKGSTTKTTLKKLKSGKKYYVRVKAYKTVNKKAVYGSVSTAKTVKVK